MTPAQTKNAIRKLFGSQCEAARILGFSDRAVRFWVKDGAPPHVVKALRLLYTGKITHMQAAAIMRDERRRRPTEISVDRTA